MSTEDSYGLAGYGRSDSLEIEVLDPLDNAIQWVLSIQDARFSLRFEIEDAQAVDRVRRFLDYRGTDWDEIMIGEFNGSPVLLVRDRPPSERYFLKVYDGGAAFLSWTFADEQLAHLRKALSDAADDAQDTLRTSIGG